MGYIRAKQPLNPDAQEKANQSVWEKYPGLNNRKLSMCPDDAEYRQAWMDAYQAAGGKVVPSVPHKEKCKPCAITQVELIIEKNKLTLKHDRECNLEIKVTGTNFYITDYLIEIKRAVGGNWCVLAQESKVSPWKAVIAGKFKLRAVIQACGAKHISPEKDIEVQFPSYSEIIADETAKKAMDSEWQNTLNDCTQNPNRCRERGYWIRLNTTSDTYEHTATVPGDWIGPTGNASVNIGHRPADNPENPDIYYYLSKGAVYSVASFHTHPPTTYVASAWPAGTMQPIGPSSADNRIDSNDDVPGVVYDYEESRAGSGRIPLGHPKNATARLYRSLGVDRRSTPN
jgi:hypothetical protein